MRALALLLLASCADNPFGRPATVVDGSRFPAELRGSITPRQAVHAGRTVSLYLLGPADGTIGEVIRIAGDRPPCVSGGLLEPDLEACQGLIFPSLPGQPGHTPYLRVLDARGPASARSRDEVSGPLVPTDTVLDLTIIDPAASFVDPAAATPRSIGWYETLEIIHVTLSTALPVTGDRVEAMDLLVPEGEAPGGGRDEVPALPGMPGYSTLCNVVYARGEERIQPSPPILLHCVAR